MTDVVFHIDEEARWEQLLSNLEYYSAHYGSGSKIVVVINGAAVRSFNGFDVHPEHGKRMLALHEAGVEFKICGNSLPFDDCGDTLRNNGDDVFGDVLCLLYTSEAETVR